jgi:streptogrisin D
MRLNHGYRPARSPARRLAAAAAGMCVTAAVLVAGPTHAQADQTPPAAAKADPQSVDNLDPATLAVMRRQEALSPIGDQIYRESLKLPESGFAGLAFVGDGLTVYWKGTPPSSVRSVAAQGRMSGPVTFVPAAYSKLELEAAAQKIHGVAKSGSTIQEIIALPDGSGLEVVKVPPDNEVSLRSSRAKRGRATPAAEQIFQDLRLTVPITVKTADHSIQRTACVGACSRLDDSSPWNSGTFIRIPNTPTGTVECTSGFAVTRNGQTYLLTAAHCLSSPQSALDNTWEFIGNVYQEEWRYDILLLNARGYFRMFDGLPNTTNTKIVYSAGYPILNELLCHSGARSGTVCNLQTQPEILVNYWQCDSDGDCFWNYGMNTAKQINNQRASQPGDSGGPVFSLDGSGVRAKGIVSGVQSWDNTTLIYQDWIHIESLFGVNVRTPEPY